MKRSPATTSLLTTALTGMIFLAVSCKTVKPYQRIYLNEDAMQMKQRIIENFSSKAHTYREGSSGGGRGKSSGGCGCN